MLYPTLLLHSILLLPQLCSAVPFPFLPTSPYVAESLGLSPAGAIVGLVSNETLIALSLAERSLKIDNGSAAMSTEEESSAGSKPWLGQLFSRGIWKNAFGQESHHLEKRHKVSKAISAAANVVIDTITSTVVTFTTTTTTAYGPSPTTHAPTTPIVLLPTPSSTRTSVDLSTSSVHTSVKSVVLLVTSAVSVDIPVVTPTPATPTVTPTPTSPTTHAIPTFTSTTVPLTTAVQPVDPPAPTPGQLGITQTGGQGTYFNVGLGSCGNISQDSEYIVAISALMMNSYPGATNNPNNNPACGRMIQATYNGNTVNVRVEDTCPECLLNSLDFSPSAFQQLAPLDVGRLFGLTWKWTS